MDPRLEKQADASIRYLALLATSPDALETVEVLECKHAIEWLLSSLRRAEKEANELWHRLNPEGMGR